MRARPLLLALLVGCGSPTASPATVAAPSVDPATAAACALGQLGDVRVVSPLPPGVTEDARERALVIAASEGVRLPADVSFSIVDGPRVEGDHIVLRGELISSATEPRDVFLSEAGTGYFHATLTTDASGASLRRRAMPAPTSTPPPALFPEPHRYTLAPGARWSFETAVLPACWELTPGATVRLHWWLAIANEDVQGDAGLTIP